MRKVSNCCGAYPVGNGDCDSEDLGRCSYCKENCVYVSEDAEEPLELVTIELDKDLFERIVNAFGLTLEDYKLKRIEVKDDFFKDDAVHYEMKKQSNNAYKRLKEYEFQQRNK